jgi:hypothetical protein
MHDVLDQWTVVVIATRVVSSVRRLYVHGGPGSSRAALHNVSSAGRVSGGNQSDSLICYTLAL